MTEFNAQIHNTFLGIEDHGIMTCFINLKWESSGQGFGGYALDGKAGKTGHSKSITALRKILETVGVQEWAELEGKYVRVRKEGDSWGETIHSIGHIVEDKWFSFKEHYKDADKND